HLAEVSALVAAERDHQADDEDGEARAEGPDVDERAAPDHQAADRNEEDRQDPRGAADQRVEAVRERAPDVAAVPAEVDDAPEKGAQRDEPEPPELGMVEAPPRRLLLLPRLRAQPARALGARHATLFARGCRAPPVSGHR